MTEFVEAILAQIIGNLSTALVIIIFYFNFLLFESYLRLIVWAILFSQALRQAKNNVISVLQYLSDDPDVDKHGFLTCVFSKSCEILMYHPHGSRRTGKELFLNYGIFVFSLIGAVSIWMRMYSWVSFLHVGIGVWIVVLSLIKILDRRIFYYRYFISDEVLVSALLILGFFITGIFVMFYLGTESYMEGSHAAASLSNWVQTNFINDERTREIWSEQVANSRAMISAALSGIEDNYNDTMWWPPVKSLVKTYYLDPKSGDGNLTSSEPLYTRFSLPENMTLFQAVSLAYSKVDSVNLTSVQLTDWTSKGLEVSSIAFGSVAQLIFLFFTLIIAFVSLGIRAFFFISSLFYLLCTNWDPIERFVEDLLPIQVDKRPQVVHSLRKVVEGVFFLPLKMSSLHALVTLVSFTLVNADFVYLATTFTFIISIVPIIPPYLVCLPWVISIWISSSFIKAIALMGVQYFAFTMLDDMLYEKSIVALNSYVSALSVVFGVYVFGFEGVIFGPLSVCAVTFAYEVSNHGIQAAQDDYSRASEDTRFDQDDTCADDPVSTTGSSFGDDDETTKEDLQPEPVEMKSPNSNIFSDAVYRVISGPLVDRVRRRLSMDVTTDDTVCITLVVEGLKHPRKVRFVVNKSWNLRSLHENLRRMLRVQVIETLTASDGAEVLSPLHIFPNEVLHVRVRPKHRPPLFPDMGMGSDQARGSLHALSPRYRRAANSTPPASLSRRPSAEGYLLTGSGAASPVRMSSPSSVAKGKMAIPVALPFGQALAAKAVRNRLRRQHSVPIRGDGEGVLRRRGSYSIEASYSPSGTPHFDSGAATFEDVESMLSARARRGKDPSAASSRASSPGRPVGIADRTPRQSMTEMSAGGGSGVTTPVRFSVQRPAIPDLPPTPITTEGSRGFEDEHWRKLGNAKEYNAQGAGSVAQVMGRSSSLLFSPLSVQDGSIAYPSEDEAHDFTVNFSTARAPTSADLDAMIAGSDGIPGRLVDRDAKSETATSTPTKTLSFEDLGETSEELTAQAASKFKYVSKAKAQQYRQRKQEKGSASEAFERDLI